MTGPASPDRSPEDDRTSTGALAVVVAAGVGLVTSTVLFPLALAIALVVLVVSVRALRRGARDRGWYATASALCAATVLASAAGAYGLLTR